MAFHLTFPTSAGLRRRALALGALALTGAALTGCLGGGDDGLPEGVSARLTVLATTDLHTNIIGYDYFKLAEDKSVGFDRTATLIRKARQDFPNTVLIDNGDTIQGTALADYQAIVAPVACSQKLAMYKVMDQLGYDAGSIGNHEFNYGLEWLARVTGSKFNVDGLPPVASQPSCAGPSFPLLSANVVSKKDGQPIFKPYVILQRTVKTTDANGKPTELPVKIAVIGFTPPPIVNWDKRWLEGKVDALGVVEMAQKYVPMARAEGADLVIAASHGGFDERAYSAAMENVNYHLAKVPGIDAILMGHSHSEFPNATCTASNCNAPGVDKVKGTINGVPAVMPSYWGKALGVIDFNLVVRNGKWAVDTAKTQVSLRKTLIDATAKTYVDPDAQVRAAVTAEHEATIAYVKTPIGTTDFAMTTYFADVGEVTAIQVVNDAQADYVRRYVDANLPQYKSLPVLSVSAPFKSGFAGGSDYTDVKAGPVAINNAADLYLYPNTVYAVKVNGAGIKAWLERAAERFNQIDPAKTSEQVLISTFPGYNFDVFTSPDVSYEIDVTKPKGSRIVNLRYQGAPMDAAKEFIIATNNYRGSGGGSFPGLDGSNVIYASPDANRDVLIDYIKARKTLTLSKDGQARSWRFVKVKTAGPVVFTSAAGKLAQAKAAGLDNVSVLREDEGSGKGLSVYAIDLGR